MQFPYHVCDLMSYKMAECQCFTEMKKMFKDKNVKLT
jgi:hypothetical protein